MGIEFQLKQPKKNEEAEKDGYCANIPWGKLGICVNAELNKWDAVSPTGRREYSFTVFFHSPWINTERYFILSVFTGTVFYWHPVSSKKLPLCAILIKPTLPFRPRESLKYESAWWGYIYGNENASCIEIWAPALLLVPDCSLGTEFSGSSFRKGYVHTLTGILNSHTGNLTQKPFVVVS